MTVHTWIHHMSGISQTDTHHDRTGSSREANNEKSKPSRIIIKKPLQFVHADIVLL